MKKYLPYIFPAIAVLVIIGLAFRWSAVRNADQGQVSDFGQSIQVEELSDEQNQARLSRVEDLDSVQLDNQTDEPGAAEVRYEVVDGTVEFTVFGNLPDSDATYQVWIGETAGEGVKKAFALKPGKAGYMASGSVTAESLPFDIIISEESNAADDSLEEIILRGTVEESAAESDEMDSKE